MNHLNDTTSPVYIRRTYPQYSYRWPLVISVYQVEIVVLQDEVYFLDESASMHTQIDLYGNMLQLASKYPWTINKKQQ